MEPLAHSDNGRGPQPYREHIEGVIARATRYLDGVSRYARVDVSPLRDAVLGAAALHDLGKLDPENQEALRSPSGRRLPVNHVDAGVVALLRAGRTAAAVLAYAHHRGLCSLPHETNRGRSALRDDRLLGRTELGVEAYLRSHEGESPASIPPGKAARMSSLAWRIALSCLVDADHSDTAEHFGATRREAAGPRWAERLESLNRYVDALGRDRRHDRRVELRRAIYEACREARTTPHLRACDAPVGSGKTTAVMAHLLRVARDHELRRIVVVLPWTAVIHQNADVYRRSLMLPGEDSFDVIGEHHHQADFDSLESRRLASLWNTPIVLTTAVQLFETLAAHRPGRLRKLHDLIGAAIWLDESHAAIPPHLWRVSWPWLEELVESWGCHLVLGSGSLVRVWGMSEAVETPRELPDLLPDDLRKHAYEEETRRLSYRREEEAFTRERLVERVPQEPGPQLVVVNTVRTAAVLARDFRRRGRRVLHLSTALAPVDRERILTRIRDLLASETEWTLVATSCIEAGIDVSFTTVFRESASITSLVQIGGRTNRHGGSTAGVVIDFRLRTDDDDELTSNPALLRSRQVLTDLWREGAVDSLGVTELVTSAFRRELSGHGGLRDRATKLLTLDRCQDFPGVGEEYAVIEGQTALVIVDQGLRERIASGAPVRSHDLIRRSVRMRRPLLERLGWPTVSEDMWWCPEYDPELLGTMKSIVG